MDTAADLVVVRIDIQMGQNVLVTRSARGDEELGITERRCCHVPRTLACASGEVQISVACVPSPCDTRSVRCVACAGSPAVRPSHIKRRYPDAA